MKSARRHENQANSRAESSPSRTGLTRGLGKAMLGKGESSAKAFETIGAGKIKSLANSLQKLAPGRKMLMHDGSLLESQNTYSAPNGKHQEGLSGIMGVALIADTAIAVVQDYSLSRQRAKKQPLIKIVELPYGEHAGESQRTGKVLAEVDPDTLKSPRADGVIQPWERLVLGRDTTNPNVINISSDTEASRQHVAIEVTAGGIVELTDLSTNGTAVVTGRTVMNNPENAQLNAFYDHLANPANEMDWNTPMLAHALTVNPQ